MFLLNRKSHDRRFRVVSQSIAWQRFWACPRFLGRGLKIDVDAEFKNDRFWTLCMEVDAMLMTWSKLLLLTAEILPAECVDACNMESRGEHGAVSPR